MSCFREGNDHLNNPHDWLHVWMSRHPVRSFYYGADTIRPVRLMRLFVLPEKDEGMSY